MATTGSSGLLSNIASIIAVGIVVAIVGNLIKNTDTRCEKVQESKMALKVKLENVLSDKMRYLQTNLDLIKMNKNHEERYLNLLQRLGEVHDILKEKTTRLKEEMVENKKLKEENALLHKLVAQG